MASEQTSIREWAKQLKVPHELLLKQLSAAGWDQSRLEGTVSKEEMNSAKTIVLRAILAAKRSSGRPVSAGAPGAVAVAEAGRRPATDRPAFDRSSRSPVGRPPTRRPPADKPSVIDPPAADQPPPAAGTVVSKPVAQAVPDERNISDSAKELRNYEDLRKSVQDRQDRQIEESAERARIAAEKRAIESARKLEEEQKKAPHAPASGTSDTSSKSRRPVADRGGRRRQQKPTGRRRRQYVDPFDREQQVDGEAGVRDDALAPQQFQSREIQVPETIQVSALAHAMSIKASRVVGTLMDMGVVTTATQVIDQDTAVLVVEEIGHKAVPIEDTALESKLREYLASDSGKGPRPPIVTVMGHIDHGKTTLLDCIRKSSVASSEAAGITQHIGAYQVQTDSGVITFIDTPGHAAFTSLRARGAQVTDLVVLVVAGDDGVMPQTQEAIEHARAAGVPIVVAINKMDKPQSDPDKVKQALAAINLQADDWGGDVQMLPVSATSGEGVDSLLEALLLEAEVRELQAAHDGPAYGVVLESSMSVGRGPTATLLIQQGRLKVGDTLTTGTIQGRVRALNASDGAAIKVAEVSMPVEMLGLPSVPDVGLQFAVIADNKLAREVVEYRSNLEKRRKAVKEKISLDTMFSSGEDRSELSLVIKADVRGSMEALQQALEAIGDETVGVKIVAGGVGGIAESDMHLAHTVKGIVLGFNVRADAEAKRIASESGVEIRYYSTIYELIEDVEQALLGILGPELREQIVGVAEVREVFTSSQFGQISGCMVVEGLVQRDKPARVLRDNVVIFEGRLSSLRRFKDDVPEVKNGTECGIGIEHYRDIREGDRIEIFSTHEVQRVLPGASAQASARVAGG